MDVTKILETDHRTVEDLLDRIEDAEADERGPLIDELSASLRAHMELEEDALYPTMAPVTGQEEVQEAETEHELAREGLEHVLELGPDEPGFGAALDALKAGIEHHVKDEEDGAFPKLRKDGASVLVDLAPAFMQKRIELGLPTGADVLAASFTKDELTAEADAAGVDGAASKTKSELAKALIAKM